VSLKRIQDFLSHDELDPESVDRTHTATGEHWTKLGWTGFISPPKALPIPLRFSLTWRMVENKANGTWPLRHSNCLMFLPQRSY
jgi:hypothetical protein